MYRVGGHCGRILAIFLFAIAFRNLRTVKARRCEEKCKEYGELVYEYEDVPVLRAGLPPKRGSRCPIVETPLIIGGVKAKPAEFPHMAAIGFGTMDNETSWHCGGTIISESYILTAAHCMESRNKGPARKVRVGMNSISNPEDSMQERNVIERIKHPDYRLPAKYHDIALLKLDVPLNLNPRVRPACLDVNTTQNWKDVIASGFGKTKFDADEGSPELMKVQLNIISKNQCTASFAMDIGTRQLQQGLTESMLCAGVMEGGKDTCQGDSGGPLQTVLEEPYCTYSVIGVTSFGKFCGFKNSPGVYSRVSFYLDWIESIVWPRNQIK